MLSLLPLLVLLIVGGIVGAIVWAISSRNPRTPRVDPGRIASTPRDIFLHLLSFVALYITVIGVIVGAWANADRLFPLPFEAQGHEMSAGIRLSIAFVVVTFPLFLYLRWLIRTKLRKGEMSPDSKLPIVLAYFTMFIVAVTTMVDLIAVVFQFLSGDLTSRVSIKAGSVLVVMGLVYWYYMAELREHR